MRFALKYSVIFALVVAVAIVLAVYIVPTKVSAQTNVGQSADAQCITQCAQQKQLADQKKDPSLNCPTVGKTVIACKATAPGGGTVTGQCIYGVGCKALTASGTNGKSSGVGDLSSLMQALGSIMKALGGGQSPGGSPAPSPGMTGGQGCATYYQVSTPSSDPCAYYVPSSGSLITNPLDSSTNTNTNTNSAGGINDIGSGGDTSGSNSNPSTISDLLNGGIGSSDTGNSGNSTSSSAVSGSGTVSSSTSQGATSLGPTGPGGANGEIRVLPNGATIIISNQDNAGNSVTAGFLGEQSSFGNQPGGIVASWCMNRPWANNFLSVIIPSTFFDSLCALRGYQVGLNAQTGGPAVIGGGNGANVTINNPPVWGSGGTSLFTPGQIMASPPLQVNIWAVPAAVPLGGRTTIYWNSKNATACTETSPDGSFSQSSLSGGAQTVPLAGATTFTISCMTADGSHATDDVVVGLAL